MFVYMYTCILFPISGLFFSLFENAAFLFLFNIYLFILVTE